MHRRLIRFVTVGIAAALLLTGCTVKKQPDASEEVNAVVAPTPRYTIDDVKSALAKAGLKVEDGDSGVEKALFGTTYRHLVVNGERIRVYEYPDQQTAWATVDVDAWRVYSIHGSPAIEPLREVTYRNLRPGNLVITMALKDGSLVDRITAAIHDWAGAAPGEVQPQRPAGTVAPTAGLTERHVLEAIRKEYPNANLTGERRPGGPGGLTGAVIAAEGGRYIVYVFPDRRDQEQANVPLWPTGVARTAYLRHGNLIVALEPDTGESGLKMELPLRDLPNIDAAESGIVEQAFELTFLRPPGWIPTQSVGGPQVRTWAYDDAFVLVQPDEETKKRLAHPNRLITIEEVAADRVAGFGGTAISAVPATFAGMPATRTLFRTKSGEERVLYTSRRSQVFYTLTGPAAVVDRIAFRATPSGQFPYRADYIRRVFAQAGLEVPMPMELTLDGHRVLFSISSGLDQSEWGAANLEIYRMREAPTAVQERIWTALAPLKYGRGRPVWEFGCDQPAGAPATGGVVRTGSVISLCARPEPASFTVFEVQTPGALRTVLELRSGADSAIGKRVKVVARSGGKVVAGTEEPLPFEVKLPYGKGPYEVTVTGNTKVAGRILAVNPEGQVQAPGAPPPMTAVPYTLSHVEQALRKAGMSVANAGPTAPEILPNFKGQLLRVDGQEVQVYVFPDPRAQQQLEISPDGKTLTISGTSYPAPWSRKPRILRTHNLIITLHQDDAALADRIESILA